MLLIQQTSLCFIPLGIIVLLCQTHTEKNIAFIPWSFQGKNKTYLCVCRAVRHINALMMRGHLKLIISRYTREQKQNRTAVSSAAPCHMFSSLHRLTSELNIACRLNTPFITHIGGAA